MNRERTERPTRTFDPALAWTARRIMKLAHALLRTCGGILRYAPALSMGAEVLNSTVFWRLLIGQAEHGIYLEGRVIIYAAATNKY